MPGENSALFSMTLLQTVTNRGTCGESSDMGQFSIWLPKVWFEFTFSEEDCRDFEFFLIFINFFHCEGVDLSDSEPGVVRFLDFISKSFGVGRDFRWTAGEEEDFTESIVRRVGRGGIGDLTCFFRLKY